MLSMVWRYIFAHLPTKLNGTEPEKAGSEVESLKSWKENILSVYVTFKE